MHWSAGTAAAPVMYCSWLSPSTIVEIHQHTFGFSRGTSSLGTRSSDKKNIGHDHRTRSSDDHRSSHDHRTKRHRSMCRCLLVAIIGWWNFNKNQWLLSIEPLFMKDKCWNRVFSYWRRSIEIESLIIHPRIITQKSVICFRIFHVWRVTTGRRCHHVWRVKTHDGLCYVYGVKPGYVKTIISLFCQTY